MLLVLNSPSTFVTFASKLNEFSLNFTKSLNDRDEGSGCAGTGLVLISRSFNPSRL